MSSPTPEPESTATDTTVILSAYASIPGAASTEPTRSLVFADAGKHYVDDAKILYVRSMAGGNLAAFADGQWVAVWHGAPRVTEGDSA